MHEVKDQQEGTETRQAEPQQEESQRRELPRRTRKLPSRFKDYILDFKRRWLFKTLFPNFTDRNNYSNKDISADNSRKQFFN